MMAMMSASEARMPPPVASMPPPVARTPKRARDTAASSLLSGSHGRKRRRERLIEKIDLQRARRYGIMEPARFGRVKYTYGGVTFVYDPELNKEITSYPVGKVLHREAATQIEPPVLLSRKLEYTTVAHMQRHEKLKMRLLKDKSKWKSHTVLVVDMSGSMRLDDVLGARSRSDGIWMSMARDFVKTPLEQGVSGEHDLVSVLVMRETCRVVLKCEPIDWCLYNKFIDFREWTALRPEGPGHYMPALTKAQQLLDENTWGSCALSLYFFSDGRPSDKGPFVEQMGQIAARFGHRLTISCVGMADPTEDFSTLENMAEEAKSYGAVASFQRPSLTTEALSGTITSLVTSLSQSKLSLTNLRTGGKRLVRTDIVREKKNTPDDLQVTDEWRVFDSSNPKQYVRRMWTWDHQRDDFVYLMDMRCIYCYKTIGVGGGTAVLARGIQCPECEACFLCHECRTKEGDDHQGSEDCQAFARDKRKRAMVNKAVPSFSVAMKESVFGEGVERIVHKFRFLGEHGQFIGTKYVAKQSRFVEEKGTYQTRMNYHRQFMRTQVLAAEFAAKFNETLASLTDHFDPYYHSWLKNLPRIRFLEPLVVELVDNGEERNILIEEALEGLYQKFNNNMGYVDRQQERPRVHFNDVQAIDVDLDTIPECSEEEDGLPDDDRQIFRKKPPLPDEHCYFANVREEDFPQAFSHFTYVHSKQRLMVVDLQGVLRVNRDGTKEYVLTDPAIHRHRKKRSSKKLRLGHLGRTDRGEKGIDAFFETHVCSDACSLLGLTQKTK